MHFFSPRWLLCLCVSLGALACDTAEDTPLPDMSETQEADASGSEGTAAASTSTTGSSQPGPGDADGSTGWADPTAAPGGSTSAAPPPPPVDPCADVACEGEERCVQGTCVGPGEDPPPPPGYEDPANGCPDGVTDGNALEAPMRPMNLCLPSCDAQAPDAFAACPQPLEGTAVAACLNGTAETSGTCDGYGSACDAENSWCTHPLLQTYVCSQATLCVLDCSGDRTCPSGMQCDAGVCAFGL